MNLDAKHAKVSSNLLIVGFGCIGQAVLPLILRHLGICPAQISILAASEDGREIAVHFGVDFRVLALTPENYAPVLAARLRGGTSCSTWPLMFPAWR